MDKREINLVCLDCGQPVRVRLSGLRDIPQQTVTIFHATTKAPIPFVTRHSSQRATAFEQASANDACPTTGKAPHRVTLDGG